MYILEQLEHNHKIILELAEACSRYYKREKERFPYHINIIQELHDNENAHSRILLKLLQYKEGDRYTLLESFVSCMLRVGRCEGTIDIDSPKITHGSEFIDGLIEEPKKYAIIIENKIWDAVDQDKQIEKYVKTVNKRVRKENIYVIYLTKDGSKTVADYSLTPSVKEMLGDRFIPMNYKNHVLPWLKEEVLPNCKVKEEYLRSAVHQYVDYLELINGMNDYQQFAKSNTFKYLIKTMGISEDPQARYRQLSDKIQEIRELERILSGGIETMGRAVITSFTEITKEYFDSLADFQCGTTDHLIRDGWYQVYDKRWDSGRNIHLEWIPISVSSLFEANEYTLVLHVERDRVKDFGKLLSEDSMLKALNGGVIRGTTFFSKSFPTQNGKPFGIMTREEQKSYLFGVYGSYEIRTILEVVTSTLKKLTPR